MSEIPSQLIDTLGGVSPNQQITGTDKNFIKDNLSFLQQFADDDELEIIDPLIELLEKGKLTNNDKSVIMRNKKMLVQIINRYEEEFNVESNEDEIGVEKSIDDVERELDCKSDRYCGFSDHNPMQGVTYDKSKKKYQIRHDKINTSSVNMDVACNKIK